MSTDAINSAPVNRAVRRRQGSGLTRAKQLTTQSRTKPSDFVGDADLIFLRHLGIDRKQNWVSLSELGLRQLETRLFIRITRLAVRAHDAALKRPP
jgi:hypothetical protein